MEAMCSLTPFLAAAGLLFLGVGCGREASPSTAKGTNWVNVASVTDHDAFTLQFKLYHAHIPHSFEQTNGRAIVRVSEEFRAQAARLILAHTNSAGGRSPHD